MMDKDYIFFTYFWQEQNDYIKLKLRNDFDAANDWTEKREIIEKAKRWSFYELAKEMDSDMTVYIDPISSDKPPDEKLRGWLDF